MMYEGILSTVRTKPKMGDFPVGRDARQAPGAYYLDSSTGSGITNGQEIFFICILFIQIFSSECDNG